MTIIGGPRDTRVRKAVTKASTEGVLKALKEMPIDYNLYIFYSLLSRGPDLTWADLKVVA